MNTLVYFDENGYCHMVINPTSDDLSRPNSILNPDLTYVANIDSLFWKLNNDQIVPMSPSEQAIRQGQIDSLNNSLNQTTIMVSS